MRAFISYSFSDKDLYIISLLAFRLQENGDTVLTSSGAYIPGSSQQQVVQSQIRSANFFVGIVTRTGMHNDRVYDEWQFAQRSGIPGFLLVEGDTLEQGEGPNIIRFNRNNPGETVQYIENQRKAWQAKMQTTESSNGNALAWILGGAALIIAINLLTEDTK